MFRGRPHAIATAVVSGGGTLGLVDPGPTTCLATLELGLQQQGLRLRDVTHLLLTHIHLDHAGAAGDIAEVFPKAQIVCHVEGARHMKDPEKLMASAYRVFGPRLDELFGPLRPVPEERLRAVDAGDVIDLGGGRRLEVIKALGHARHHMAVQDSDSGVIFVGDSMGVYLPEAGVLRPAAPPPDFDLPEALATLRRYREREPSALYLTHFGPAPGDDMLLGEAEHRLVQYGDIVRRAMEDSTDLDDLAAALKEATRDDYAHVYAHPELEAKFEALNAFRSSAAGYLRYFQTTEG
jgi:glyoxylase-like metal-dependent hydrolase (beta-lactamase superfamily II)